MVADLKKKLDQIKPVEVLSDALAAFASEDDFNQIGVDILAEAGSYVCVAASILPGNTKCWDRNQAIVGGSMVRLYKLISAMLDQTSQQRRETTSVFLRLAFETIVNIRYLIMHSSQDLFDSYVRYSLRHEKKLYDRIQGRIKARNDGVLPIETRMLRSIQRTEEKSGISLATVTANNPRNWGDKNLFERAEIVGMAEPYQAMFGGGSHSVHGNWMDLLNYHLDRVEGGFHPRLEWTRAKPQTLFATILLTIEALREYFAYIGGEPVTILVDSRLHDLWQRNKMADEAHERFLTSRMSKSS